MQIILREDVANLGKAGEVVSVRDGYGRNFLIPYGKAVLASAKNIRELDHQRRVIAAHQAKVRASAEAVAAKLSGLQLTVSRKVGEQDKLYGSVTNKDIAEELASKFGVSIDRHTIQLDEPIKALGTFSVAVKLHSDVAAQVAVTVVAE
jgi:large subunit ribosomal protein L9